MNERGFFTIIGLCLLLIAAISIKGVHEFEANYSRGISTFQAEHELQNLADSYLAEAFENFSEDFNQKYNLGNTEKLKNITVEIYGKYGNIKIDDEEILTGQIILSVASCDSDFITGKIYRRALAYKLDDDETIYFINDS